MEHRRHWVARNTLEKLEVDRSLKKSAHCETLFSKLASLHYSCALLTCTPLTKAP